MKRNPARNADALREVKIVPGIAPAAEGSVLVSFGATQVICAATIEEGVPRWMKEQGVAGGWLTAEYSMLPYCTSPRKQRDATRGKIDGRSTEIQRLIGRSLRAVVDLKKLGQRTLWVDCDVLQADGGTRTAAITGACVAVELAFQKIKNRLPGWPLKQRVAAVSAGIVRGEILLDLDYSEDSIAEVDCNLVMTESGEFVEVQASGEEAVFDSKSLETIMRMGHDGIEKLFEIQRAAVA